MSATITVNGEVRDWKPQTMGELLAGDGIEPGQGGLAVARNANVVPRREWDRTAVERDDRIEIVQIVRGG